MMFGHMQKLFEKTAVHADFFSYACFFFYYYFPHFKRSSSVTTIVTCMFALLFKVLKTALLLGIVLNSVGILLIVMLRANAVLHT